MNEAKKKLIIDTICGGERMTMCRAKLLLSASINFVQKEAYQEAEVCNDEAIKILEKIMFKIKENRSYYNYKLKKSK